MLRLNCNIVSNFRNEQPSIVEKVVENLHIASKTIGWKAFGWDAEDVDKAMHWVSTPQGHDFWSMVDRGRYQLAFGVLLK